MPRVVVAADGNGLLLQPTGRRFIPWGFNYDRTDADGLLEDWWVDRWPELVNDFREMRDMGGNVVRIHLQYGKFMDGSDKPNEANFQRLQRLVSLAEESGL